jgi:pyridoxamine 5'-phosphate oxidase
MRPSQASLQRTKMLIRHVQPAAACGAAAPWRSTFLSHIDTMDSPTFVLSSLHHDPSSHDAPAQVTPRARTVVFRGMWASLPANPKNPAERNPDDAYETDLLSITTDARMDKVSEILPDSPSSSAHHQAGESGRGGPVEAVFWMPASKTQWRLRGHAFVIGRDIDGDAAGSVRAALGTHMRPGPAADRWRWSKELTAHFGNMSPVMRGSFRNPPPGTPITEAPGDGLSLGQKVDDLEDSIARSNFRVVLVAPDEVDQVDLSDPERARRWNYRLEVSDGTASWKVTELWP